MCLVREPKEWIADQLQCRYNYGVSGAKLCRLYILYPSIEAGLGFILYSRPGGSYSGVAIGREDWIWRSVVV